MKRYQIWTTLLVGLRIHQLYLQQRGKNPYQMNFLGYNSKLHCIARLYFQNSQNVFTAITSRSILIQSDKTG